MMAIFTQAITAADVLAGLTTDSTKWAGANIANLDATVSGVETYVKKRVYIDSNFTWDENADGSLDYVITRNPRFVGTWYLKYQCTTLSGGAADWVENYLFYEDANNKVYFLLRTDAAVNTPRLYKKEAAAGSQLITSGVAIDTSEHYSTITRDGCGNYELFLDGTTKGTANDEFLPAAVSSGFHFEGGGGNTVFVVKEIYQEVI